MRDPVQDIAMVVRVGIFHPVDPDASIPSGIDTLIRTMVRHAPPELEYTVFGAATGSAARLGEPRSLRSGRSTAVNVPLVTVDRAGRRDLVPLTVRYLLALHRARTRPRLRDLDLLEFHRVEPLALFANDRRPKHLMLHHDMADLRNPQADIAWRHAPWLYEFAERRWITCANRVLCVRRSAVARYASLFPSLSDRFEFAPTFVDTSVFQSLDTASRRLERRRLARDGGPPETAYLLISVGRLDRQKNPLLLLEAVRRATSDIGDVHLLMIGDGDLRGQVEARIARLDLARRVTLLGALPQAEIATWLQVADLLVLSSAFEGMPIAALEALASGIPVVTTDVGEVRLVVRDAVDGFVVREQTAEALTAGIVAAHRAGDSLRGAPCVEAVAPYSSANALERIYQRHLGQVATNRYANAGE
jgi:glycosyltransferase involved in cell wall biosynthesis